MGKLKLRVGSILEIPLSEGRKGYGRYLYQDPEFGQLFQVYDIILKNDEELNVSTLKSTNDLFSPIFVGISGAIKIGFLKVVAYLPVENFTYPGFLEAHWGGDPPVVYRWFFWNGSETIDLGVHLPEEYKRYEYAGTFAAQDIAMRIETGEESFVKRLIAGERKD